MDTIRRELLIAIGAALGCAPFRILHAQAAPAPGTSGNFRYIYADQAYRQEFKDFLVNVFRLYPENELHDLIAAASMTNASDRSTYVALQTQLDALKPFLGDLTYSLPTLKKQKTVLAEQTVELLGSDARYEGYLEVGSNGRFLDSLEERLDIEGDSFVISPEAPTNSLIDIIDRGQIFDAGTFVALNDYRLNLSATIPPASIDLVTVYIGFHHCPVPLRESFIGAIRDVLRPGGALVVRDHDVRDDKMLRMVALAHDVFNMGTRESWETNEAELRNFYSLATLDRMLTSAGFETDGRRLYQDGDPTLNALMLFRKV
jgi:SAM-dependent methyltransferase